MKAGFAACFLACCGLLGTEAALAGPVRLVAERVAAVDPHGVLAREGGSEAVLAGMYFPDAPLAVAALEKLRGGDLRARELYDDRYGRAVLILYDAQGNVQERLLKQGVAVLADGADALPGWRAAEAQARTAHRGVWGKKDFMLAAANAAGHDGEFHVVEGVVRRVYHGHDAAELNFGADWKSDFSVSLPHKLWRDFDMEHLAGRTVRVRGMLYEDHGPMIAVANPAQLEVLK